MNLKEIHGKLAEALIYIPRAPEAGALMRNVCIYINPQPVALLDYIHQVKQVQQLQLVRISCFDEIVLSQWK